eukprot:CAMPEP_0113955414 /NCGR_PEP_ID=MMETSP0011_2-20120614/1315_1 /TAXON_ID=101924 /ORGANISM="Rhodosorus marinus" /LENGTH=246 /DNA_ID=CAMNT_0000965091 /DNA_START=56 /DNA_END=797 /DNA_ORIENTATION=+ /assembly_acc=CAM_ASM_000156
MGFVSNGIGVGLRLRAPGRCGRFDGRLRVGRSNKRRSTLVALNFAIPPLPFTRFEALVTTVAAVVVVLASKLLRVLCTRLSDYIVHEVAKRKKNTSVLLAENVDASEQVMADRLLIANATEEIKTLEVQKAKAEEEYKSGTAEIAKVRASIQQSKEQLKGDGSAWVVSEENLEEERDKWLAIVAEAEAEREEADQKLGTQIRRKRNSMGWSHGTVNDEINFLHCSPIKRRSPIASDILAFHDVVYA